MAKKKKAQNKNQKTNTQKKNTSNTTKKTRTSKNKSTATPKKKVVTPVPKKEITTFKTEQIKLSFLEETKEGNIEESKKETVQNLSPKDEPKKHKWNFNPHKFWTTFTFESIYIFVIECLFKMMMGSFIIDYALLRIALSSIILALIISVITTNLKNGIRKTILIIFNLFVTFYAWLQLGFLNFLGAFMSIGNAEQGTKIGDYIVDFLVSYTWNIHLIYIPFIVSIIYYIFEKKFLQNGYNKKVNFKNWISDAIILISFVLLSLCYYATIDLKFMQNRYQTITNKSLLKYPSNPSLAIKNFGTTIYFGLDVKGTLLGGQDHIDYAGTEVQTPQESTTREIDDTAWKELITNEKNSTLNALNSYFINRPITEKNEYTGMFKDKNVIFIMLESIGAAVFDEEYKDYFPTLNKLYNEGITGVNNYSPRNNCATGESEMTAQLSLYSITTTCTVNTYRQNDYPEAFMSLLKNNGYYTSAYHDYTDKYYYRSVFEPKFGSMKYYGVDSLGMKYNPAYIEWPSDVDFMEKALPKFIDEEKFASFMVTVTAHTPYMYYSQMGEKHLSLFKDLDVNKSTKRYLSKVKEDDLALEYLLNTLEEKGILDDTVIVLFGDHYPYGLNSNEYQSIANFDTGVNQEVDRTPFIIYNSETTPKKITKVTTPLDYAPTLLNLLGIEYDPRLYMGNDIFSDYTDLALFPDNSWQSSYGFYSASKGRFIPENENEPTLTDEEIIEINNLVTSMRNMSALAIKKNYFNYLFKYFEQYKIDHLEEPKEEEKNE